MIQPSVTLAPVGMVLGDPAVRPGIAGTAYDTAWIAGIPARQLPPIQSGVAGAGRAPNGSQGGQSPFFPTALQWLVEHQWPDGSWGGAVRYEHDRILCTLAALAPLSAFGRRAQDRACVADGLRYLWQHGHLLRGEPIELVGFELLLPALVQRARQAGIVVPPHLDIYGAARAEKLRLLPRAGLYSPRVTVVHSLEFLGEHADHAGLRAAQGPNGALGNSPAATAFFFEQTGDPRAQAYLRSCLARSGGSMAPVLHPCETFELLWAAYHLFLAGVPARRLLYGHERHALREELQAGGVSLSPTFPIPDADDTAVALLLLHDLGDTVDPAILQTFAPNGSEHFVSFPYERHASVGVNLHVLHALLRVPGYPNAARVTARLLEYLVEQQIDGLYWLDKWHISPYYATAHAICILHDLPLDQAARMEPCVERAREWLRQTQNRDGSWGHFGQPTAEETAYAVLALEVGTRQDSRHSDRRRCLAGARYLRTAGYADKEQDAPPFPPLWIDKCLYTPTLIVRSVIDAALIAAGQPRRSARPSRQQEPQKEQ